MKTICVPKTQLAQTRLNFDECEQEDLMELHLNKNTFDLIWHIGFFKTINKLTNSLIDDFEDESITNKTELLKVLNSNLFNKNLYDSSLYPAIDGIKDLFNKAVDFGTGVYFYF